MPEQHTTSTSTAAGGTGPRIRAGTVKAANGEPITAIPTLAGIPPTSAPQVDYAAVRTLRATVSEQLTAALRDTPNVSFEYRQAEGERIAARVVRDHVDTLMRAGQAVLPQQEQALLDAVAADLFGLGRLQQLLSARDIVNVHILGCDNVRIEHADGRVTPGPPLADSDDELLNMFQTLAMRAGATERSLNSSKPWLDMQLPDGSRLTVFYQISVRPYAVIRRHTLLDTTLEQLRDEYQLMDELLYRFLVAAVDAGCNIMIAGLADAGKTTLLRALLRRVPPHEAYITLEESRELGLHRKQRWVMSLEAREGHGARGPDGRPAGEVTLTDMIPLTLRMSVRRVICGEVRSREIVPMLQAMATSRGSMCTIHVREPAAVMDRIIELALQYGQEMSPELARRMAAGALDLIVYITVDDQPGRRYYYISHIVEIGGMTGDQVVTTTIFAPGPDGRAVPAHLPERLRDRLARVGYDPRQLTGFIQLGQANQGAWAQPLNRTAVLT